MAIEKVRHGAEIESSKLNEMITAINENNESHQEIRDLAESIKQTTKDVYNELEKYSEQVAEHLDAIPEIKNLYADILLARDSIDWIDLTEDDTDTNAQIAEALTGYEGDKEESAQRLKIIRGNMNQITLNTPEIKDKQILIAYDDKGTGIMYFDIGNKRIPVSSSGEVKITAYVPKVELKTLSDGSEVMEITNADGSTSTSGDLRGPAGAEGKQGIPGPQGDPGEKGETGKQGIQGVKGQDGASTLISVWFSNYEDGRNSTEQYNGHKYMGIKTYLSTATAGDIAATPIKWFRITGDVFYPIYDSTTGYLSFTTTKPETESSFYIKGDKGDTGATGPAPEIYFRKDGVATLIEHIAETSNGGYVFDASIFKGDKGDDGEQGERGERGEKGKTPYLHFKAKSVDSDQTAAITETTPSNSQYDAEYTIDIPKGKNGLSIIDIQITAEGHTLLYLGKDPTDPENIEKIIDLGNLKGEKGEKGEAGTITIKGAVADKNLLPLTNITAGDAYVVTSTVDDVSKSELYICVDNTKESIDEAYKALGNIKGDKGDAGTDGKDGSTWILGTVVTGTGVFSFDSGYKVGDTYLNTSTNKYYKILAASGSTYTLQELGTLKGEKGDQGDPGDPGETGVGISKIELTSTLNNTDTYTITLTNAATYVFNVTNGEDGKDGIGKDGTTILTGTTDPNTNNGNIDDLYLNSTSGVLWKKEASGWATLITLKGDKGKDGVSGTRGPSMTTLDGTSAPTATTNYILGDIIYVKGTCNLYELTGSADNKTWSLIGNIKGEKGDKGDPYCDTYTTLSDTTPTLVVEHNTIYKFENALSSLTLDVSNLSEPSYWVEIIFSTTAAFTLSCPDTVRWQEYFDPTTDFSTGYTYTLYIEENKAYVTRFPN